MEFLADRPLASRFAPYLLGREPLLASALQLYEIYKVIRRDRSEEDAVRAVAALRRATIVPVEESLALAAAEVGLHRGLAMADAIIYACARRHEARLVTADADFDGLPGVVLIR